jgi:hypothetical protein
MAQDQQWFWAIAVLPDKGKVALNFKGFDLTHPPNREPSGSVSIAQNVRTYSAGSVNFRNLLTNAIETVGNPFTLVPTLTCSSSYWTNPANATSTSLFTSVSVAADMGSGTLSLAIGAQTIPTTATIAGIKITCNAYATSGSQSLSFGLGISGATLDKATLTTTAATYTFGGNTSLWGATVTPAIINAGFTPVFEVDNLSGITATTYVNSVVVTIYYTTPAALHTIRRLNDSTPNGPANGYVLMTGVNTTLFSSTAVVAIGLSGNPVSMIPFRPNSSVQPWMYVGDSAIQGDVTLETEFLITNASGGHTADNFPSNGMMKVRSDNVCYKMGIKEPQLAPSVSTENSSVTTTGVLYATAIPWTNYPTGTNSDFDYGETEGYPNTTPPVDGTAPYTVNVQNATTVTITIPDPTDTVIINGNVITTPTATGLPLASTNPGYYVQPTGGVSPPSTVPSIIIGAFTDGDGNVIAAGQAPLYIKNIVDVGGNLGVEITVPSTAVSMQIGIDSTGNTFSNNSGSFSITVTVTTNALPLVVSTLGTLSLSYWGDSPSSGQVGSYIWKNPDDSGGSGPTRSTSNADGSTTGNSFIFDASFGTACVPPLAAGIPGLPGVDISNGTSDYVINNPMEWFQLTAEGVVSGSNAVFASPLTSTYTTSTTYTNFNFCLTGSIYIPAGGYYKFVLTNKDQTIWGIGGSPTFVSASATYMTGNEETTAGTVSLSKSQISSYGQTISVVSGIALLPVAPLKYNGTYYNEGGQCTVTTVILHFASAGIHSIEIDYDFWYHSGRILLLMVSPTASSTISGVTTPTIVLPLSDTVREEVQYRYTYRSSATGATSNPSPESTAESVPVKANTITSNWSNDPQVDKVDYYRVDSAITDFTYVCTGPNDDLGGGGTNTPVSDSLTDTELGTNILVYTNYEPFPSIDLPQKGICTVSSNVITWVSGGAIGGTATGFNTRWLAGTIIKIGSPTSLAYTFISRPSASNFAALTAYALDWVIEDTNGHYQLVTTAGISGSTTPTFSTTGGTTVSGTVIFTDKGIVVPDGFVNEITIPGVPDGTDLAYEISEPILAAQPLPYLFGPTDNINYTFGVGDTLRPGTLYWCSGSNLDAAPDTNQMDVTDPGEPLVNGAMSGGRGVLFSIRRAWVIMPNFFNALATVTGTTGSTWTLQATSINRGLFMPRCVAIEGGGLIFFRVDDGIHFSPGGGASKSITDDSLYPIFPHENEDGGTSVPQPVTREGVTIYPPDDTQSQLQKFSIVNGYLYYDYVDTTNVPRTLVFDIQAMGWVWDVYEWPATIHATNEGLSQQGVLVGCNDGSIRQLASGGTETGTAIVQTPAIGGKGWQTLGPVLIVEYSSTSTITLTGYAADADNGSYGPPAITIPSSSGALTKLKLVCGASKWKLLWFQFTSTVQFQLNLEDFVVQVKDWGSTGAYREVQPFAENGGGG